jgi:hypothetical protein
MTTNDDVCPHDPTCRGLFSQCVTAWLEAPPIGTPESLRLGRLMHRALHPTQYCYLYGCGAP